MSFTREDACRVWLSTAEINDSQRERLIARHGCAETAYDEVQRHGAGSLSACGLSQRQCAMLLQEAQRESMHWRLVALSLIHILKICHSSCSMSIPNNSRK